MTAPPAVLAAQPGWTANAAVATTQASPWLSVLMPTHVGDLWIDASLESIAAEDCRGIEVIMVDSSPDGATLDRALRHADRLLLRTFSRPDLPMWPAKTNFAATLARAPYLCWLHQDDLWLAGRAGAIRRWIDSNPEVVLHIASSIIIDGKDRRLGFWTCPVPPDRQLPPSWLAERLIVQNFISTPAPVFRTDAWRASGGLDEDLWYTADWDIWLRLVATGPVRYHGEPTTAFRVHGGSLTMSGVQNVEGIAEQMHIVINRHLPSLPGRGARVRRLAEASCGVNVALAAASAGNLEHLPAAAARLIRLGPVGIYRYFRDSRLVERLLPRVAARFVGAL